MTRDPASLDPESRRVRNRGERATAPTLDGVNQAHVGRYRFAALQVRPGDRVLDAGCGSGYGARILADAGGLVHAVDVSSEAVAYARRYYPHPDLTHYAGDLVGGWTPPARYRVAVCLETIEHVRRPDALLVMLARALEPAGRLVLSTPNARHRANRRPNRFHRHVFTDAGLLRLAQAAGFQAVSFFSQPRRDSERVVSGARGRYLILVARNAEASA